MKYFIGIVIVVVVGSLVYFSRQAYLCGKQNGVFVRTFWGAECIKR